MSGFDPSLFFHLLRQSVSVKEREREREAERERERQRGRKMEERCREGEKIKSGQLIMTTTRKAANMLSDSRH